MRLWKNEKYSISAYVLLLLIFISGFAHAADPLKVENKYIEMVKGNDNAPLCLLNMLH